MKSAHGDSSQMHRRSKNADCQVSGLFLAWQGLRGWKQNYTNQYSACEISAQVTISTSKPALNQWQPCSGQNKAMRAYRLDWNLHVLHAIAPHMGSVWHYLGHRVRPGFTVQPAMWLQGKNSEATLALPLLKDTQILIDMWQTNNTKRMAPILSYTKSWLFPMGLSELNEFSKALAKAPHSLPNLSQACFSHLMPVSAPTFSHSGKHTELLTAHLMPLICSMPLWNHPKPLFTMVHLHPSNLYLSSTLPIPQPNMVPQLLTSVLSWSPTILICNCLTYWQTFVIWLSSLLIFTREQGLFVLYTIISPRPGIY
jgi:hypothetical protein